MNTTYANGTRHPRSGTGSRHPIAGNPGRTVDWRRRIAFWIVVAILVLGALSGGSARADAVSQSIVRLGEAVLVALLLVAARPVESRSLRLPILFMAVVTAVLGAMLVPLPPAIWTSMPGRGLIAEVAPLAGVTQPWRPVAMVPPLAWNAFFAMIPPAAMMIGLCYLSPADRARLVWPMAGIVALSALLGLVLLGADPDSSARWYDDHGRDAGAGLLVNRNHQALLLAIGFPVVALWARGGAVRFPGAATRFVLAMGAAVLFALSLLLTGSRAGLALGAVAILGCVVGFAGDARRWLGEQPPRTRGVVVGAALVAVAAMVAVALLSPQARSVTRLYTLDVAQDMRATAWPTLRHLVGTYFPVGTGFGGFERAFRSAEPQAMLGRTYFNAAHDDYLQVLIEGGVVGIMLVAAFILWWLVQGIRLWRGRGEADRIARRTAATGWLTVLLILAASAVDYPVRTPLIMVVLVVACGWIVLPRAVLPGDPDPATLYDPRRDPYSDPE